MSFVQKRLRTATVRTKGLGLIGDFGNNDGTGLILGQQKASLCRASLSANFSNLFKVVFFVTAGQLVTNVLTVRSY